MFQRPSFSKPRDQRGVTLVEQLIAAALIGMLILVWVNSIRVTTKGTVQSKNSLRAQNLGLSKLEDVKALSDKASYASTWSTLTQTALVKAYRTPVVSTYEKKNYTWQVQTDFAYLPVTYTGDPYALTYTAVAVSWTTSNLLLQARISWDDITGPKVLTMTGYATDFRQ
jgi:Tfp pilus assembly protein PilV